MVGQTIYIWRTEKGLTQSELAVKCGVSRPNLSAIEQGARDLTVQTLRRIAKALDVSPGVLVDGVAPRAAFSPSAGTFSRFALDRIARLAAGRTLKARDGEKRIAAQLASIMKSKTRRAAGRHGVRDEQKAWAGLKSELGAKMFGHLLRRAEKHLAREAAHE